MEKLDIGLQIYYYESSVGNRSLELGANNIKEQREITWGILDDSNEGRCFIEEGDIIVWNRMMNTENALRTKLIKPAEEAVLSRRIRFKFEKIVGETFRGEIEDIVNFANWTWEKKKI